VAIGLKTIIINQQIEVMKNAARLLIALPFIFWVMGCKKDDPTLGEPPTTADAAFTYAASATSDNIIVFTATNSDLTAKWDFGNGTTGEGTTATATYPNAGTYTVVLTVFNTGGSASSQQSIVIAQDDPTLLDDPIYTMLTGGASVGAKTWVIDSTRDAHFGVGPNPIGAAGYYPEYYAATKLEKTGAGFYDDQFVFTLAGFGFDQLTNGSVYINSNQAPNFPDATETNVGDFEAPYADQTGENWTLVQGADTTLTVSGNSFLGYYTGVNTYRIVRISENELFLRYEDAASPDLAWYIRLVPSDYPVDTTGNGGTGGGDKYSLPLDFESDEPVFTTFGNSTYGYIANPDASGINTSSTVLETVHGSETWAGLFVDLENPLDFSTDTIISLKVWAPATGAFRFKIENSANTNEFVEVDAQVTTANAWQEISVSFSGAANVFDRLVIFPGWDVANAGTFYIDDIVQQ